MDNINSVKVTSKSRRLGLNFTTIRLPKNALFPHLVEIALQQCISSKVRLKKLSQVSLTARQMHCHTLIEGLYQVWACKSTRACLNVYLSPQYYHSTKIGKINHLSQYFVEETVNALGSLGWIEVLKGARINESENRPTQLKATGELLEAFKKMGIRWTPLDAPIEGVILRGYDRATKESFPVKVPKTIAVRKMNANLRKINEHLGQQAICLHVSNDNLRNLIVRMTEPKYRSQWHQTRPEKHGRLLNFNHRLLRRVFSRESLQTGGRFYGGWWQFIPSEFREYITINGQATTEIDFSELHPRLLYLKAGSAPPTGDLYDIGLHFEGKPYDANVEPYKTQRGIVKEVFNALLNDESGRYRMQSSQIEAIGIKQKELKRRLIKKHPPLKEVLGKGVGLEFQYIDSQVAEKVMLGLLARGITCLPMHDSFIVQRQYGKELHEGMTQAFGQAFLGQVAKIKPPTGYKSDFRMSFLANGELDHDALFKMHEQALHNKYLQSWRHHFSQHERMRPKVLLPSP